MNTAVQVPEGMTLLTRDTFLIPKDWVAIWHNPNKTRQWMFWVPEYRSSYFAPEEMEMNDE